LTGLLINYALNHGLTFRSEEPHHRTFPKFAFIAGLGLGLNLSLMALFVHRLKLYYMFAQVLATGVVLVWNFVGNRWWTFREDSAGPKTPLVAVAPWVFIKLPRHRLCLGAVFLALVFGVRLASLGLYPLVDPSESRYAEMARKMVETDNWVTPQIDYGVPFWGKPPLAVWLNAFSLKVFGVNEFAVRLSALALCAGIAWIVYRLAATRASKEQACVAPALLAGMALFFVLAGSIEMDQCLVFGTTLVMASFWRAMQADKPLYGYLFFVGLAIGLMAKGPIAIVLTGLPIGLWTLLRQEWLAVWRRLPWLKGSLLMLALSVPWYLVAEQRTPGFLEYFFVGEHWKRFTEPGWQGDLYGSGRAHARGMIWVYWLVAALPWSLVFLAALGHAIWHKEARRLLASADGWRLYCLLWMLSPLLFFTVSANLIWTYVLPGLPGCALLLAEWRRDGRLRWFSSDAVAVAVGLLVPVLFLAVVAAWQFVPFEFVRTQKLLVDKYYQTRSSAEEGLYYLRDNPFSAQFYTAGHSKEIANVEVFQNLMERPGQDFFVCPKRNWADMPEAIKDRLRPIGTYSGFMLLRHVSSAENP
jgi:4-amino-4-deoxy-L-arabinose transferase-like glycosyltransferase